MQPQTIPEARKFSPYFVFYLIATLQVEVGMLGFQRIIAQLAGYDSWQSVIFAGVTTNIVMWFMFKQLEMVNGDLCDIHWMVFGKWIGNFLNLLFAFYFLFYALTTLRGYIEIIQVWMFPDLKTFWFAAGYLLLCIYIIFGGIRTIVGIGFFSFVLPFYIIYIQGYTIPYSDFRHFSPIFDHSFNEVLKAAQNMSLSNMGYETILIFYPFIKSPNKSKKWGHLALIFTTVLYLYLTFISFAFYSQAQLKKEIWATLTSFKIVKLPVVERFEYIGIANWCLIILPNICLSLWCAGRLLKRTIHLKQKYGVIILSAVLIFCCTLINSRNQMDIVNNIIANLSFLINYMYIPILFVLVWVIMKIKTKRKS